MSVLAKRALSAILAPARAPGLVGAMQQCRAKSTAPVQAKTARHTEVSADGSTHTTTFANGLRVASEANPGHFTALGVYVDAGSRYEDAQTSGYAHLLDRLAFRNSEQLTSGESMTLIEKLGGSIMSSSSRECIMYQGAVFPHDVPRAIKLLAETTLRPRFLAEEVSELQAAVPWELQDVRAKPDLFLPEKLHEVAFQNGGLGHPLLCSEQQLARVTPEALAKYHAKWYTPERIVVAAVGIPHADLVALCDANGFADLERAPAPSEEQASRSWMAKLVGPHSAPGQPAYTGGTWMDAQGDMEFTQVYLGFPSAGINDEGRLYAFATLQMLLGGGGSFSAGGPGKGMYSRLYTRVLNQHAWIESCMAFHHCYTDAGLFGISASCGPRNEHALLDVVAAELETIAKGKPARSRMYSSSEGATSPEVRRAKNQLKSNLLMNLESRMVQLEDLGRQIQVSGKKMSAAHMVDRIDSVTVKDVAQVAAELLEHPATLLAQGYVDGIKQFYPQLASYHGIKV